MKAIHNIYRFTQLCLCAWGYTVSLHFCSELSKHTTAHSLFSKQCILNEDSCSLFSYHPTHACAAPESRDWSHLSCLCTQVYVASYIILLLYIYLQTNNLFPSGKWHVLIFSSLQQHLFHCYMYFSIPLQARPKFKFCMAMQSHYYFLTKNTLGVHQCRQTVKTNATYD